MKLSVYPSLQVTIGYVCHSFKYEKYVSKEYYLTLPTSYFLCALNILLIMYLIKIKSD